MPQLTTLYNGLNSGEYYSLADLRYSKFITPGVEFPLGLVRVGGRRILTYW